MAEFIHGNQSIHYELAGVREFRLRTPVLLLHGNGEDMHIFDNMIAPQHDRTAPRCKGLCAYGQQDAGGVILA